MPHVPFRPIRFGPVRISSEPGSEGTVYLRSELPLEAHDPSLAGLFRSAVEREPDSLFLSERTEAGQRRCLRYAEAGSSSTVLRPV